MTLEIVDEPVATHQLVRMGRDPQFGCEEGEVHKATADAIWPLLTITVPTPGAVRLSRQRDDVLRDFANGGRPASVTAATQIPIRCRGQAWR
jgi:hypothetical protein